MHNLLAIQEKRLYNIFKQNTKQNFTEKTSEYVRNAQKFWKTNRNIRQQTNQLSNRAKPLLFLKINQKLHSVRIYEDYDKNPITKRWWQNLIFKQVRTISTINFL